jgi:hypothetical protein
MTQERTGWHHCGKCGEVYQATQDELCPACERTPLPSKKKINVNTVDSSSGAARKDFNAKLQMENTPAPKLVRLDSTTVSGGADGNGTRKSTERKRKTNNTLIKFLIGWGVSLTLIAGLIKWRWGMETPVVSAPVTDTPADQQELTLQSENLDLLTSSLASILKLTDAFLQTSASESLAQYCRPSPRLAMTIFNDGAKATLFKPDSVQLISRNVIRPNDQPLIETIWADNRGRKMEIVYAREEDRWMIDWESYAKSSTLPWSIFHGAEGEETGTFRLLVRERLADQNYNDLQMSIVFYEPAFLHGGPLGLSTPEFLVDRKSRNGRLISAALEARKSNKPLMDSIFPASDPPNTARVCVTVRRTMKNGEKVFELEKVLACHWLGIDHPGVDLTDSP